MLYKEEGGNIVVMSSNKNNDRTVGGPNELKSELLGEGRRKRKMNNSHLYKGGFRRKELVHQEKPLFKKKISRPLKSRQFKKTKTNRGIDSLRDQKYGRKSRDLSKGRDGSNLSRQKTFDTKKVTKGKNWRLFT